MYREYERYNSVLCSLMWFKYIKRKSSGSYNIRGWVDTAVMWFNMTY